MKRNYLRLTKDLAVRMVVTTILIAIPVTLAKLDISESPILSLFSVAAVLVFMYTAYRFIFGIYMGKCRKILRHYPLEFRPRIIKKESSWTKYGDRFTMRIADDKPGTAPLMRAVKGVGGRGWPKGTEGGVWVAGDAAFGGVVVVPGSYEMLFFQPARWDKHAQERGQAGAERLARARQARIERRRL
ncbi:hypothetical protein [Streptomyces pathocidini]|uniref:hypothetical protein n=1 Tax=Streptomyces pathocidini TaxID=1650571 RepID=UPI0012FE98B9|nr:hypothetical protein [Streptomyces pathocidini]